MKVICIRETCQDKKLWQVGEIREVEGAEVPEHFKKYNPNAADEFVKSTKEMQDEAIRASGHSPFTSRKSRK